MLIFVVCLAGHLTCETRKMPFGPPMACVMQGQAIVANWLAQHPAYELVGGWKCDDQPGADA